eukprot:GHVT01025964.1.p2 GENE.GHVT01025964.1~~GHVT01025964.1.p2  ORF type:complete len:114 (-),score=5.39 GHVT01025964.1:1125-1466(-)
MPAGAPRPAQNFNYTTVRMERFFTTSPLPGNGGLASSSANMLSFNGEVESKLQQNKRNASLVYSVNQKQNEKKQSTKESVQDPKYPGYNTCGTKWNICSRVIDSHSLCLYEIS